MQTELIQNDLYRPDKYLIEDKVAKLAVDWESMKKTLTLKPVPEIPSKNMSSARLVDLVKKSSACPSLQKRGLEKSRVIFTRPAFNFGSGASRRQDRQIRLIESRKFGC